MKKVYVGPFFGFLNTLTQTLTLTYSCMLWSVRARDPRLWKRWTLVWRRTSCGSGRPSAKYFTPLWPVRTSGQGPRACCRSVWLWVTKHFFNLNKKNKPNYPPKNECVTCEFWSEEDGKFKHCRNRVLLSHFFFTAVSIAVLWFWPGSYFKDLARTLVQEEEVERVNEEQENNLMALAITLWR